MLFSLPNGTVEFNMNYENTQKKVLKKRQSEEKRLLRAKGAARGQGDKNVSGLELEDVTTETQLNTAR
jgi:hypothetical protein